MLQRENSFELEAGLKFLYNTTALDFNYYNSVTID